MKIEFVAAKESDLPFLLDLRLQTMVEHLEVAGIFLSKEEHMFRIKDHFDSSFIIYENTNKIGFIKYLYGPVFLEIDQLQILPEHQGKGLGRLVLSKVKDLAIEAEKSIRLKVLKENPAKHLYLRNGFIIYDEDTFEYYMELIIPSSKR